MQGSGPLRQGEVPPWHKRTTVRDEKRRLQSSMEKDDKLNKRDNNQIRLANDQQVHVPAVVLIEYFTPSNINDLYECIDSWPIRPPEYLDSLKDAVRKWRSSEFGGAWRQVTMFAQPDSDFLQYSPDPSIPAPIQAVDLLLMSPLPSLTAVIGIFYPSEEHGDLSDELRKHFTPRVSKVSIRAKGKVGRFTHRLPFSRAKEVFYNFSVSRPDQLQREHVENLYSELEAHCWQWLNRRAPGKLSGLPVDHRPSLRCLLLDNLEPFGPINQKPFKEEPGEWTRWYDSDSEEPYREPRGPLAALELGSPMSAWTTKNRDSFYFSVENSWDGLPYRSYLSAKRSTICAALKMEEDASAVNIFNEIIRENCLGLLSAWTIERLLSRYIQEISLIRDSSASSQSAYKIAESLNNFLAQDGHDAAVIARDAAKRAHLDYSFRETPPFIPLLDIKRPRTKGGEANEPEPELLVKHLQQEIARSASIVSDELEMATRSISTSATLLQSMASIRLQWWSLGVAVVATIIAVLAVIVSS